jgi:hypothetical protein
MAMFLYIKLVASGIAAATRKTTHGTIDSNTSASTVVERAKSETEATTSGR